MAILVVAIHVRPFSGEVAFVYDDIIARIADPLFFMITAFLFFEKIFTRAMDGNYFSDRKEAEKKIKAGLSWKSMGHYMKRLLLLYTAWFVIYLPRVIRVSLWEYRSIQGGELVAKVLLGLVKKYWLSGYYGAMWFITALIIAMPLTFLVCKYLGPKLCLILSAPWFLLTVARMEYSSITDTWPVMRFFDGFINGVFGWYGNGLTYGFFFCALGMWVAYRRVCMVNHEGTRNTVPITTVSSEKSASIVPDNKSLSDVLNSAMPSIIAFLLLVIESHVIRDRGLGQSFGAMFFLIPSSYCLLLWLLKNEMSIRFDEKQKEKVAKICMHLRRLSTLIFAIHYGVMETLQYLWEKNGVYWNTTALYVVVLLITLAIGELILLLQKKFKWLRIFY